MAAKKKETYRVVKDFLSLTAAHDAADKLSVDSVQVIDTYVCPHCDKPWPTIAGKPIGLFSYRMGVEDNESSYCCDATRLECEAKKRPVVKPEDVECPFSKSEPDL